MMARRDPVLIVIRPTRVRRPDGRVVCLMPGYKNGAVSDRIKSLVPSDALEQMKKG